MASEDLYPQSVGEEIASALTHGVGALLSLGALTWMVVLATTHGDARHVVSCSVFGAALVLLYSTSTLYHAIPSPRLKPLLQMLDHSAIYLLIAGTYTPFTLVSLQGAWGWSLFGVVWGAAVLGIVVRCTVGRERHGLAVAVYIAMGWVVVVAVRPLLERVAPGGLWMILLGGLCYTGGAIFYLWRRLPYQHAIWHLFVLAGSLFHVLGVLFWVIPRSAA